ncbi:MAG TPA: peptidase [Rheinheimera sp.]|uniref:S41 family peptidase n=1 Tax=Rheinheimera sp. TaxID=1869214 RepID=UPI000EC339C4|nr:S41 family peptidase [Rheinheimera sp.]HCU66212.1 peptidase [Rheinheimera sp.]
MNFTMFLPKTVAPLGCGLMLMAASPLLANTAAPVLPATAKDWALAAKQDIAAAYQLTADNHPGMANPLDPDFPALLQQAQKNAMALLPFVDSAMAYEAAIARFSTTLQDGHAGAFASLPDELRPKRRWPGFIAVWRGDALWVYHSAIPLLSKGMQIVACDGVTVETLIRQRVFQYSGQVDQPGHWWAYGGSLFTDDGNPFTPPLAHCDFKSPDGSIQKLQLSWTVRPDAVQPYAQAAYDGDPLDVGLYWHLAGTAHKNTAVAAAEQQNNAAEVAWIAMPTFNPSKTEISQYESLFSSLQQQKARLQQAKAIVLDLRRNEGGSSYWSFQVAGLLWGKELVQQKATALFANTEVWWFASAGNTAYVKSLYQVMQSQGQDSLLPWISQVGQGMEQAQKAQQPFFIEADKTDLAAAAKTATEQPQQLNTPVYVIVPGQCASACLDAIDIFKLFDNTRLVGTESSSDSTYMDVRFEPLPSGLAKVVIPNKMYVNRPREKGVYYRPDVAYHQLDWSTQALLDKVLTAL